MFRVGGVGLPLDQAFYLLPDLVSQAAGFQPNRWCPGGFWMCEYKGVSQNEGDLLGAPIIGL